MLPIKYAFFCKVIITPKCSYRKLGSLLVCQMTAKCTSIDHDNNLRPGADKEGEGGLRGSHVVPPPSPVPPSPLEPSAVQRAGSPSGGRVYRGGGLTPVLFLSCGFFLHSCGPIFDTLQILMYGLGGQKWSKVMLFHVLGGNMAHKMVSRWISCPGTGLP